jgi:DUF1009 family protein
VNRYAVIAGNGLFPLLALENARKLGDDVVVIALKEEASKEVEALASRCHWISIGELSRLISILKQEGISEVMMTGQVKHASIFSSIQPDWRLFKLLMSLKQKNTESLNGGVAKEHAHEGNRLVDSTQLMNPQQAGEGGHTRRKPH